MKKTLLTAMLAGIITVSYCASVQAATVTVTKPTVTLNSSQEESAISKKMKEIEQAKQDAKEKQEAREKAAKEKQEQRETAVKNLKQDTSNTINNFKNSIK